MCSFSVWPLLGTLYHTYVAKTYGAYGGQQHRVPAWPAGHPMEFQHGLLVVQESITLISVFLLVLAAFGNVGSYIAKTPPGSAH